MHEDAGGHESLSCHQDGSTADKSPAVSHTQPVTNTQDSFIRWCVFIRINLSPCNAFRRSVLAGRLFYLQIPNTEKWNIIQSPAFCFCVLWVCVWLCLCVSVCVCARLCPVSLPFSSHMGSGLFHQMKWGDSLEIRKMAVFPLRTPTTHMQKYTIFWCFMSSQLL